MSYQDDPRLEDAKLTSVVEILERLEIYDLRDRGMSDELCGPCPQCGDAGHDPRTGLPDRFNINTSTGQYFCRRGCFRGGDQIQLVRDVLGLSFPDALTWIAGDRPEVVDQEALAKKRAEARSRERARKRNSDFYRKRQIERARALSASALPGHRGVVGAYLRARGLPLDLENIPLKFVLDHPYVVHVPGTSRPKEFETIHSGPAMIADFVNWETGEVMAVHQTWIDPEPPHDKARIFQNDKPMNSKKMMGSAKGNFIPLVTPPGATVMISAEGIENTLSAYFTRPAKYADAAFWAGGSLSNMAGEMLKGQRGVMSGLPDLESDKPSFIPPPWVEHLIFIQDGDSDPDPTRKQLLCGLRRAHHHRPSIKTSILPAPPRFDVNDLVRGKHIINEGQQ